MALNANRECVKVLEGMNDIINDIIKVTCQGI